MVAAVSASKRAAVERELLREIEESMREVDRAIQGLCRGPLAGLCSGLVRGLFAFVGRDGIRRRAVALQRAVLACASEPSCRNDMERGFGAHLKNHEAWLRVDRNHPKAPRLKAMIQEEYRAQVELASRLLTRPGETYEEMVRSAFPECRDAEEAIRKRFRAAEEILAFAEREKDLFRVPSLIRRPLFSVSRQVYAETLARVVRRCRAVYQRA